MGGFGGGREGVQLAEYQTQSDRNRALLQAGLLQQGYGSGQQARQSDLMNQLTLGGAQAGLAQGQLGMGQYQQGLAQLTPQLAGGGDIDRGAEVMENLMENLEAGGEVSEDSQGLEGAQEMFANTQRLQNRII